MELYNTSILIVFLKLKLFQLIFSHLLSCVIAPGDIFEITDIDNYSSGEKVRITFKKEEGIPGDRNICPKDALLDRIEIPKCELVKTEGGIPEGANCEIYLQNLFNKMEKIEAEEQTEGWVEKIRSWFDS